MGNSCSKPNILQNVRPKRVSQNRPSIFKRYIPSRFLVHHLKSVILPITKIPETKYGTKHETTELDDDIFCV